MTMSVVGGQPKKKKHANPSYEATKHIKRMNVVIVKLKVVWSQE